MAAGTHDNLQIHRQGNPACLESRHALIPHRPRRRLAIRSAQPALSQVADRHRQLPSLHRPSTSTPIGSLSTSWGSDSNLTSFPAGPFWLADPTYRSTVALVFTATTNTH